MFDLAGCLVPPCVIAFWLDGGPVQLTIRLVCCLALFVAWVVVFVFLLLLGTVCWLLHELVRSLSGCLAG